MSRATVPSPDETTFTPTLVRPTSASHRLRGRFDRLRLVWRRVAIAAGAGLTAAGLTMAWLTAGPPNGDRDRQTQGASDDAATGDLPADRAPAQDQAPLADTERILALDRSTIALPVSVGSVVEVIGLRPTVADVRAEVIAARAGVVGVTDQAILVAVDADAAHRAAEIAAVGQVTILGRDGTAG